MELLSSFFDIVLHLDKHLVLLVEQYGTWVYAILFVIIFSETGLVVTPFLPGDSLLVTAGLVASQGLLDIVPLAALLCAAAVIGDTAGYWIGYHAGPRIFSREDSFFFHKKHLERTAHFFDKYGGKTIILARFVPIVRTFAPTVAGMARMDYKKFIAYNMIGGIAWVLSMTSVGYFLGRSIPNIDKKIHHVVLIVIFLSFLPIIKEWWSARKEKAALP
jgi:membrane-associated protein